MNLRSVDLNLLVALNALLSDLHVTRAADRIGLSQPAMSNALSRLRHIFKDELLVRTANGMQATPRAIELAEPVKRLLRQLERLLDSESAFDPTTTTRSFSVRLSDLLSRLLLPAVGKTLATTAPSAQLDVVHYSPTHTVEALEKDEIDLAISMGLAHSNSIKSVVLMKDRMVCVMREGHPLAQRPLTMETFLQAAHLKVSMSPTDLRFVDDVLARQGLTRRVAVNVPHWLLVPHVLRDSDLLSVMPRRLAFAMVAEDLAIRDLPFASDPFEWSMYWHRRHDASQDLNWLRSIFVDATRSLPDND
ncbi:LysR family transcriptional regulator [Bradyrhizobium niftali]|uniref:LysR family transcriptional regulator n=1 Tax=Bradyrhizobium niftali TaxID=2560055 RepID=A0A4Y9M3B8_9BRAD|nr:LysR family transcriptional regulator [Bradyrhizobium niftali]TFV49676.1 LysR family transcriptional regulator [Bradyrhizobium niftali]